MATCALYPRIRKANNGKELKITLFYFLIFIFFISSKLFSQDEKQYVFSTFRASQLINMQTPEVVSSKSFDFTIKHRFGMVGPDTSVYEEFLGLDLPANIRFGFAFPLTEKIYAGIGRTKRNKTVDAEIKYLFLRQTEDNKIPVSAAAYFNTSIGTDEFPKIPSNAFFSDSVTPFKYRYSHRLSYNTQIIIARKFSEKISMQISPVLIYKNLVAPGEENQTFTLPFGGVYKYKFNSSLMFEYAYRFSNRPEKNNYPVSLGWEVGTAGHAFQIVISTTNEILEKDVYTTGTFDYLRGNFALGFNIRRTFWKKQ